MKIDLRLTLPPKRWTESSDLQSGVLWQLVHVRPLMSTILGITFSGH